MKVYRLKLTGEKNPSTFEGTFKQISPSIEEVQSSKYVQKADETEKTRKQQPSPETNEQETNELETKEPAGRRRSAIVRHNPEKTLANVEIVKYEKNERIEQLLKTSLKKNEFLKHILGEDRLQQVVDAMRLQHVQPKEYVITEGDIGAHLYVTEEGSYEVTKNRMLIHTYYQGETFGELAILYNTKRFASVQALTKGKVWVLDRDIYQKIMVVKDIEEHEETIDFLKNVPQFKKVNDDVLNKVTNLLKKEFFPSGRMIVKQGERGDKFYIIKVGSVLVTKNTQGNLTESTVGILRRRDYFGELALFEEDCRQASIIAQSPGVECLTLDRQNFLDHFRPEDLNKEYDTPKPIEHPQTEKTEYDYIRLEDLSIIQTLGVGAFGRVELVQYRKNKKLTFALKCLKKIEMVEKQQQEHVYSEKDIMSSCKSEFICKFHNTYRNSKYIYFLMEVCLGGDVWTLMQKSRNRCFSENVTRFMAACVLEAFAYLHSREIIYRDLKPENLMIDSGGYVKLVDFGLAKKLGSRGKTYTFAGTPDYVAPEIILNRGHNKAVDFWALGIFIYELIAGKPPFRGSDHMKTYNLILLGIGQVNFPSRMSRSVHNLVRMLCKPVPSDRVGCQRDGPDDIRKHRWFADFDWNLLKTKQMPAPIKPVIKSNIDCSNFEKYPKDTDIPPDEISGWDKEF